MAAIFLDTSALVRRYDRTEVGSAMVHAACARSRGNDLIVARHVTVEVASAFGRHEREVRKDAGTVARLWLTFQAHVRDQYQVIEITEAVFVRAEQLVFAHALRASDAIHVSCALVGIGVVSAARMHFWTADRRQADAASAEGLDVVMVR